MMGFYNKAAGDAMQVVTVTKKDQDLLFASGNTLRISVERMFEVGIYEGVAEVARIRFEALSSLNNLELPPLYRLSAASISAAMPKEQLADAGRAAIALFQYYTNGSVRVPDEMQATLALA